MARGMPMVSRKTSQRIIVHARGETVPGFLERAYFNRELYELEGKREGGWLRAAGEGRFVVITWHRYATARHRRFWSWLCGLCAPVRRSKTFNFVYRHGNRDGAVSTRNIPCRHCKFTILRAALETFDLAASDGRNALLDSPTIGLSIMFR